MSRRCGMLLLKLPGPHDLKALLGRLGFSGLKPLPSPEDGGQVMGKADDHVVGIASVDDTWVSLWGQFDFNLLPECSVKPWLPLLGDASVIIYFAVEGTSDSLIHEHYEQGMLTRAYMEVEGQADPDRCCGEPPPRDPEFDQVDEWGLLEYAMPEGLTTERLLALPHEHYQFSPPSRAAAPDAAGKSVGKPWWKIW